MFTQYLSDLQNRKEGGHTDVNGPEALDNLYPSSEIGHTPTFTCARREVHFEVKFFGLHTRPEHLYVMLLSIASTGIDFAHRRFRAKDS